jgi:RNA ligase (TIGR02306 family)
MERKLASVQKVAEIKPIENSDNLQHYRINGWWVVDRKDQYGVGDEVVYFEIDSWIPHKIAAFLSKGKEPREFLGVPGERLRTIKLRGALSQGLILPYMTLMSNYKGECSSTDWYVGQDVTDELGVLKWEPPINAQLAGMMKGNFPHFIRKTDQERVQNIPFYELQEMFQNHEFEVSEKLDGSSMTIYHADEWGVCSRNVDLKLDQEGNSFVDCFNSLVKQGLKEKWDEVFGDIPIAIQGELIGQGIQGNQYNILGHEFRLYNVSLSQIKDTYHQLLLRISLID